MLWQFYGLVPQPSLVVARRQAPLIIGLGEGEFICASDTPAIANFTNIILPMEDDEIALLTPPE